MKPRILVIRGGAIGDFILTLPAIRLIRESFPNAHLEILGYKHIIALAEGRFYADATRSIEYAALSSFFVPHGELAQEMVDYFGSFQQVVSYLFDPDQFFENNLRRCGVKHFLHVSPKLVDSEHAAQQLARPLQRLALYLEQPAAQVHPSVEDRAFAGEFHKDARGEIIAIHPGSGSERKNWPLPNWIALGKRLHQVAPNAAILLVGGEADRQQIDACRAAWHGQRVLAALDLPLPHLAAVLERCTLFLGHDSGISHLAAAVGTPCILLFGPTDRDIWAPANPHVTVLAAEDGEISQISVEEVENAVASALRSGR